MTQISTRTTILELHNSKRAVRDELCSPNRSLFRRIKAFGKWLSQERRVGMKQASCAWSSPHLPMLPGTSFQEMLKPE